jgi:RNA polymerase sigma-70 factor (ECF subfamily)
VAKLPNLYESILLEKLQEGDKAAFSDLVMFSTTFTHDLDTSEEIVQEIFVKLWEDRKSIIITTSLKSYLLKSIQNRCIDWIRHLKVRDKVSAEIIENSIGFENNTEEYLLKTELEQAIESSLSQLPDDLAEVFRMNRYEGMKYHEIAEKLNVSLRTIEVRIGKALHLLREHLKDFLGLLFLALNLWR